MGHVFRRGSGFVFEEQGLLIQEWDRVRTDWLTIRDGAAVESAA